VLVEVVLVVELVVELVEVVLLVVLLVELVLEVEVVEVVEVLVDDDDVLEVDDVLVVEVLEVQLCKPSKFRNSGILSTFLRYYYCCSTRCCTLRVQCHFIRIGENSFSTLSNKSCFCYVGCEIGSGCIIVVSGNINPIRTSIKHSDILSTFGVY